MQKLGVPRAQIEKAVENLRKKGEQVLAVSKAILKDGAAEIVNDAKSICPVKTGKLRDSIKAKDVGDGVIYEFTADAVNKSGKQYAQYIEYSPKINRPFLFPAIDRNAKTINDKLQEALKAK